jgi:hypothetical protein
MVPAALQFFVTMLCLFTLCLPQRELCCCLWLSVWKTRFTSMLHGRPVVAIRPILTSH